MIFPIIRVPGVLEESLSITVNEEEIVFNIYFYSNIYLRFEDMP